MIKQQHAVVTSIRATLAHRNSDRDVQMLVIIYKCQHLHHPEEKGPIDRDMGSRRSETDSNMMAEASLKGLRV